MLLPGLAGRLLIIGMNNAENTALEGVDLLLRIPHHLIPAVRQIIYAALPVQLPHVGTGPLGCQPEAPFTGFQLVELILQLLFSGRKLFVCSLQLLVADLQLELVLLASINVHPD
ncbi:hypothetical protein D3C81_1579450 [compost metagenome]